jgi:uncharacterized delta-60 repeat protein
VVARYLANGEDLDPSFNTTGWSELDASWTKIGFCDDASCVLMQGDNILVAGGNFTSAMVSRYDANGNRDLSFGTSGIAGTNLGGLGDWGVQSEGNIVLALNTVSDEYGNTYGCTLVCFDADGYLDLDFGPENSGVIPIDCYFNYFNLKFMRIQPDDHIIAGGDGIISLFDADGQSGTTFMSAYNSDIGALWGGVMQSDGKVVLAGYDCDYNPVLARLNADGSLDADFGVDGLSVNDTFGVGYGYFGMAIQPSDGKIIVGGYDDASGEFVARYNAGGVYSDVNVTNVAPTLPEITDITVKPGQLLDLTNYATFTDPGFDDPQGIPPTSEYFIYSVDWGDNQSDEDMWVGNVTQGGPDTATQGAIDAIHIYDESGVYQVELTITDDDGGTDTNYFNVQVVKPALTISDGQVVHTAHMFEEYTITLDNVVDPGGDAVQFLTVNWGDGLYDVYTAEQITQNNQVTHVYSAAPGAMDIKVDLTDDSGTYIDVANSFSVDVDPFIPSLTELDFDAGLPNIYHIANFGENGTNLGLSVNAPEGFNYVSAYFDDSGNGFLSWSPDGTTLPDDYTVTVTATYDDCSWPEDVIVHVDEDDMPPVFPYHYIADRTMGLGYSHTFSADDKEDSTLGYSLSDGVPDGAKIDSTGLFFCVFTGEEGSTIFNFDITATDSAGQYDTVHVSLGSQVEPSYSVQVDPVCSLEASGMTQVDGKYILAAGETATATLTINYPREDDVPVAGIWSISYDPTVISVSGGGDESSSNQLHLIKGMTSDQTITLTITGKSGGISGINASWCIWSNPTASPAWQFGIGSGQSIDLAVIGAKITAGPNILEVHKVNRNDLAQASLEVVGITPTASGQVMGHLQASGGISLWADADGTIPFSTESIDLYAQPLLAVYVKGVSPGDAELSWTVTASGASSTAKVSFDVIKIDILKGGTPITDTTSDVVVGQKISLIGSIQGLDPIWVQYCQWAIPGSTVKKYVQETKRTFKEELTNVDYLRKNIDYYWIGGGMNQDVTFTLTFAGMGFTADARFNVLSPTATLTETPTSDNPKVNVSKPGFPDSGLELHFGSFNSPGMTWSGAVTTTNCPGGEIELAQLVNTDSRSIADGTDFRWKRTTEGAYVLDPDKKTGDVRNKPIDANATVSFQTDDTPGAPLLGYNYYYCSDKFVDYLMYRPAGGVWVTLRVVTWSWNGTAIMNLETGHWACTDPGYLSGPSSDSTELPTWEHSIKDIVAIPDNS